MLRPLCLALAVCACLPLALPAWGAEGEQTPSFSAETPSAETPAGGGQAEAKALIDAGRFGDALVLLQPMLGEGVVEANALFLYGLAAVGAAEQPGLADDAREALLVEAVAAFVTMLVDQPELVRVRLELARTFYLLGEDAGLVFCPPAEHRELMSGLAIPFSMWQCAGHGDAAGPGFVR